MRSRTATTTMMTRQNSSGRRRRAKAPPIQDVLKRGQDLVVQVSKEPISTKGPRVTAQVSLAGRFLVYMPHAARVGVSRKIGIVPHVSGFAHRWKGCSPKTPAA